MKRLTVNARPKTIDGQQYFWNADRAVGGMAETRNLSGEFFEVASAAMVGGTRLRTCGTSDVCPDVRVSPGLYVESKGSGRNGAVIVYEHRKAKDESWTRQHRARLLYAVWNHAARVEGVAWVSELYDRLVANLRDVILIPSSDLYAHCIDGTSRVLNTKGPYNGRGNGYGGPDYKTGWTVRTSRLRARCDWTGFARVEAFGRPMVVTVHTMRRFAPLIT